MPLRLSHLALTAAATATAVSIARAQPATAPTAQLIDQGVADVVGLQTSLKQQQVNLRQDNTFERVYQLPDGRFMRRAGATVAVFDRSQYSLDVRGNQKGQRILIQIPAGTVFYPCGVDDSCSPYDLFRSRETSSSGIASWQPGGAGNALSGGYAQGRALGPLEDRAACSPGAAIPQAQCATVSASQRAGGRVMPTPVTGLTTDALKPTTASPRAPTTACPSGSDNDLLATAAEESERRERLARLADEALRQIKR
ncbi:MAG TPA: hypothetical protein VG797_05205 [Phycisphaerales bacterium]|nr:hypothetical protein [Phycisphaerales bacterium]